LTNESTTTTMRHRLPMTTPRRLMLVLGTAVLVILIGVGGFAVAVQLSSGSFPVNYTFPSGHSQLTAQFENGTITLQQSSAVSSPVLTGTAHYTLDRSSFTDFGDTAKYHCPWQLGQCALDTTLRVPANSPVSLAAHGSDVNIPSLSQNVTLNAGGGDVTAGTVSGDEKISTGGGDLTANSLSGVLNLSTDDGDIQVDHMTGPSVQMNTGGGDVNVSAMATLDTAKVESNGGDITVTCAKAPANLQVNSNGGDITIVLPHGSYVFLNSDSQGGDISEPASDPEAKNKVTVQSGGGDVTISEAS
jgi:hypothetical protein